MVDYENQIANQNVTATPGIQHVFSQTTVHATIFRQVYGWMAVGLTLSGLIAWYTAFSNWGYAFLNSPYLFICVGIELVLVITLSAAINKISTVIAAILFLLYAAVNGLTLAVIFIIYDIALIQRAFFISAAMFGGLALYGTITKSNLSGIGSFCGMALWGLIIALVVNFFLGATRLDLVISFIGILVFSGLTMYDAQKIKQLAENQKFLDSSILRKFGILGALTLYLDFINLFLYLLRFLNKKR